MLFFIPALAGAEFLPVQLPTALVAGSGDPGYQDGAFWSAKFLNPGGLVLDQAHEFIYVADTGNNAIRRIDLNNKNNVTTLCGGRWGDLDGAGSAARLSGPTQVALWPQGDVLVFIDQSGRSLKRVALGDADVITLPSPKNALYTRIISDGLGHVLVADAGNHELRLLDPATGGQTVLLAHPLFNADPLEMAFLGDQLWAYAPNAAQAMDLGAGQWGSSMTPSAMAGNPRVFPQALTVAATPGGAGLIPYSDGRTTPGLFTYMPHMPAASRFVSLLPGNHASIALIDVDGDAFNPDPTDPTQKGGPPGLPQYLLAPPLGFYLDASKNFLYVSASHKNDLSRFNLQRQDWDYNIGETTLMPKPAGTERLLFVGGSTLTWGPDGNLLRSQWFPKRFEQFINLKRALRGCGTPLDVEVLQIAGPQFPGSALGIVRKWAPVAAKSQVDSLVLLVDQRSLAQEALGAFRNSSTDDLADADFDPEWQSTPESPGKFGALGPLSRKLYGIYKSDPSRFHGALVKGSLGVSVDVDRDENSFDDPEIRALEFGIIHKAMLSAAQAAKKSGLDLKIVLFPINTQLTAGETDPDASTTADAVSVILAIYCKALGIGFVNMIPALRVIEPTIFPLYANWHHLLPRGHEWAGWTLAELWDDGCANP